MNNQTKYIFKTNNLKYRWYYFRSAFNIINIKRVLKLLARQGKLFTYSYLFFKDLSINLYQSKTTLGCYNSIQNEVVVNLPYIKKCFSNYRTRVIETLVHEDLHSVLRNINYDKKQKYRYFGQEEKVIRKLLEV